MGRRPRAFAKEDGRGVGVAVTSLLSLDLSGKVGFSFFAAPTSAPRFGTFVVPLAPPDRVGRRYVAFADWIADTLEVMAPAVVAYEGQIPPRAATSAASYQFLGALVALVEEAGERRGCRLILVSVQDGKRALTGNPRADKHESIVAAVRRGWNVADDHQADALGVALAAYEHLQLRVPDRE